MKEAAFSALALLLLLLGTTALAARDFYDLKAIDAAGKDVALEQYRGKVNKYN